MSAVVAGEDPYGCDIAQTIIDRESFCGMGEVEASL